MTATGEPRIGLALSGGGARAIAFHLGCLRALDELGLLRRGSVLSTVSGGSVIGAAYSLHEGPFGDFETKIRDLLRRGLAKSMSRSLFSPLGLQIFVAFFISSALPRHCSSSLASPRWSRVFCRVVSEYPSVKSPGRRYVGSPAERRFSKPSWI